MKYISSLIVFSFLTIAACQSCGKSEQAQQDATEAESSQILTAGDELEQAKIDGRNAAREFLGKNLPDTMSMQAALLEAKAKQSKYSSKNKSEASDAFDEAFIKTLETVRPDIAKHLSKDKDSEKK